MDYRLWKNPDSLNFLIWILGSKKAFFPFLNIFKHVFLFGFDKNKNMEKFPIFDRNHRLITPLEKSQFFNFFNFLILESKNTFFFFLEYHQTHFAGWFWQ